MKNPREGYICSDLWLDEVTIVYIDKDNPNTIIVMEENMPYRHVDEVSIDEVYVRTNGKYTDEANSYHWEHIKNLTFKKYKLSTALTRRLNVTKV